MERELNETSVIRFLFRAPVYDTPTILTNHTIWFTIEGDSQIIILNIIQNSSPHYFSTFLNSLQDLFASLESVTQDLMWRVHLDPTVSYRIGKQHTEPSENLYLQYLGPAWNALLAAISIAIFILSWNESLDTFSMLQTVSMVLKHLDFTCISLLPMFINLTENVAPIPLITLTKVQPGTE